MGAQAVVPLQYLSVCSGIEAASVAWHPLGWQPVGFSEIEKFPSLVLAHHYPDVPNFGDMLALPDKIRAGEISAPDILCGGTPCQAFSVAGLRQSLSDDRGNLSLTFCEIADAIDHVRKQRAEPAGIIFWENVPGVLNTSDNAFGCFLGALSGEDGPLEPPRGRWKNAGCVFGPQRAVAWRVLDAQYFGVAQRRRRVFVVASARDGFDPLAVLFESEGVRRDSAPSREAGQKVAPTVVQGPPHSRTGNERVKCDAIVLGNVEGGNATTLSSREYKGLSCGRDGMTSAAVVYETPYAIQGNLIGRSENAGPQGIGVSDTGAMYTLTKTDVHGVAQPIPIQDQATRHAGKRGDKQDGKGNGLGVGEPGDPCYTLTKGDKHAVANNMAVRRLTPTEAERLQGFPDGYTDIEPNGKPTPDSPRYKALGNSWAVPVVRWLGERIAKQCSDARIK